MRLSDALRALCGKHDLTGLSVGFSKHLYGTNFHAYAHWENSEGRCAGKDGETAEDAIRATIEEAIAMRGNTVFVPPLMLSEEEMAQLTAEDEAYDSLCRAVEIADSREEVK